MKMTQEEINALNDAIRNLNIFDKLSVLKFAQRKLDEPSLINDKLFEVANETFVYLIDNNHLPEALNPYTWDYLKEENSDINNAFRNLNIYEKARVLAFVRGIYDVSVLNEDEKLAEIAAKGLWYSAENNYQLPEAFLFMTQEEINDLNDAIRNLKFTDKIKIIAYVMRFKDVSVLEDDEKLKEIGARIFLYMDDYDNNLPEALNPSKWD